MRILSHILYILYYQIQTNQKLPKNNFQEVLKYQERQDALGGAGRDTRPYREYSKPTVEKIGRKFYFFATDVFDLSEGGKKMNEEELAELPIRATFTGEEFEFKTDRVEAFKLLMRILHHGNQMQDREFYSFPLGKFPSKSKCRNLTMNSS